MNEQQTIAALAAAGAALLAFARWALGLWATIRREDISAAKDRAALDREAAIRVTDRQIAAIDRIAAQVSDHTARDIAAQAEVKEAVVRLEAKVDTVLDWQERTTPAPEDRSSRTSRSRPGIRIPRLAADE